MKKRRLGLRMEMALFCVLILVLSLILQILFNQYFAKSMAWQQKEDQIETLFSQLVAGYSDDPRVIYGIVSEFQDVENLRVQITGADGAVIFSSDPFENRKEIQMPGAEDVPPVATPVMATPEPDSDMTVIHLEQTIEHQGESRTIYIWTSIRAIDTNVMLFTRSSVVASGFAVLIALVWVVFFTNRLTKPILKIEAVAQNVANLHFAQRADEDVTQAELSSLAVSINTMSKNLEEMITQLHADKEDLTVQVEQAQRLEQMRRQFIANISHEMKTPLSMLMMYSESLRADVPGIDKTYYYDTIIEEAAGLNAMVGQMLDISSIENGLLQLDCHDLDFSAFASGILDKQTPLFKERNLVGEILPELWCHGDEKYLEQALNNYLSNALAHSEQGDTITVSVTREGQEITVMVANPGQPIAQADLPHIWESFYRADQSRTQKGQKRVGLGLYIVKTCIEAHGGTVGVTNGDGTVAFWFKVPVKD
ncbi:ATP-binding protein [Bengtsoniella intestinalis]|uniref:sensor histidine kinase n=1 Tax=Bengtsoniella intestinalis TaxID=3073143 RepID=UPI00391F0101